MEDALIIQPSGTDWSWEKNKWFWGVLLALVVFMVAGLGVTRKSYKGGVALGFLCWMGLWTGGYFLGRKRERAAQA